jgi:hypothetical protein
MRSPPNSQSALNAIVQQWRGSVETYFDPPTSNVVFCQTGEKEVSCTVAASGIHFPNGLAKVCEGPPVYVHLPKSLNLASQQGPESIVYTSEFNKGKIAVFEAQPDTSLKRLDTINV